ncbi:alkaline phosphatase PhoX [Nonomuraea ferruginea]
MSGYPAAAWCRAATTAWPRSAARTTPRSSSATTRSAAPSARSATLTSPTTGWLSGGTFTLRVTREGEVLRSRPSLSGTLRNCSGGPMPWGAWISCEETVDGPDVA